MLHAEHATLTDVIKTKNKLKWITIIDRGKNPVIKQCSKEITMNDKMKLKENGRQYASIIFQFKTSSSSLKFVLQLQGNPLKSSQQTNEWCIERIQPFHTRINECSISCNIPFFNLSKYKMKVIIMNTLFQDEANYYFTVTEWKTTKSARLIISLWKPFDKIV